MFEEIPKKESKKDFRQPLKNILSVMIDLEKIKRKISKSLKENKEEKYFLLNYKWFKKYIKLNHMDEIFNYLTLNKIVESYINNNYTENTFQNDIYISEILQNLDSELKNKFNETNNFNFNLPDHKQDFYYISTRKNDYLIYYKDFILISPETKNLFESELNGYIKFNIDYFLVFFGDNKIFIIIQEESKKIIEIGELNEVNVFQPKMFFEHQNNDELILNKKLLIENGYNQYQNYYLMFNDDYISPIFDQNNNRIGRSYRFNETINDYSKIILREEKMKSLIGLYFSNYKLKTKFNNGIKINSYYIINENYLKKIQIYSLIENELNKIDLNTEINVAINSTHSEYEFDKLLNGKKIAILLKKILSKNDNNLILNDVDELDTPNLVNWSFNNIELFYFDNFRLIDQSINQKLEENEIQLFKNKYDNIINCYIIETFILIDISNNNMNSIYNYTSEICEINNDKIIKPLYLLAYNNKEHFIPHLNYILNLYQSSFKTFLESLSYTQGNGISLQLEDGVDIGYVYKLSEVISNQNQNQNYLINQNNNNLALNNNINMNSNNNPNININLSINPLFISNITNNFNNNNEIIQNKINLDFKPEMKPKYNSIEQEFKNQPLIGLKNVGATCYMNATLQCFCNIKTFVNYFKYNIKNEVLEEFQKSGKINLTISFKYLIENLWKTEGNKYIIPNLNKENANNKYYIPVLFKEKISKMNPLFEGKQANDAKDLVNFLILTLHEELNKAPKNKEISNSNMNIDQSKRELVFANAVTIFANENMSLISDLFYAMNDNVTQCLNCHINKYNFQIYFFLIFPLEEIRKFKIQNEINLFIQNNQNLMNINPILYQQNFMIFNNNLQNINSVNLDDCFRYNQKIENFSGENAMYCNYCKMQCSANYKTVLTTGPEILVIILNRGKGIEFKVKCEFVLQLNLYEYIEMKDTGFMYDLVGVVTHMGESGASGHFIAYCKSPIDHCWYNYNDDLVFPVNNFVNDVINYAMPYILFYQKIK